MSIRLRLTVWYSTLLAFTLFFFCISIYTFVDYNIYNDVKAHINKSLAKLKIQPTINFEKGLNLDLSPSSGASVSEEELFVQIINFTNGERTISNNMEFFELNIPMPQKPNDILEGYRKVNDPVNGEFLLYEQRIDIRSQTVGAIQVFSYTGREAKFTHELRSILVVSSLVTIVVAFSLGLFLAQKSLRPIENIIRATNRIQTGNDLSVRIPRVGPPEDEIGQLTETINRMLGRMETFYKELDEAYRHQRRFVSDVSHELRTPLTTIRGNVDLLQKMNTDDDKALALSTAERDQMMNEALNDISDESKRMSQLINDMLSLARADAGQKMELTVIEIKPLVEEVARRAQFLPRKADWHLGDIEALDGIKVHGNRNYLQQMLFIFIENAFKYTSDGEVTLSAVRQDDQIGLRIRDSGIGMNQEEVPYIFERFYRADVSRGVTPGTGLGLAIAKWIIDEHGGSVEVLTKPGQGTTFIVWLPTASVDEGDVIAL
ncbi:sensor histidine kinase [Paenibacillus aquistagni]|uniref:histidine kinase n=1 Tax=Paenibacillus aquistagni TaxID=1852522 RepID=A0A1X7LL49_9BACL|nr:HAMP domain-containing sensor histidine kinase [Paenibacillus aquistagni]NMM53820.1 HAMP domain-containing histidine kinase [Paenibacillus aquistagni]SMG54525.1 Signal transduction histidine kinase [Paenibacillus aquistagni]